MLAKNIRLLVNFLQIRSLRQLVLISFLTSLVPLIALLWQSQRDFSHVSVTTKENTELFVNIASNLRDLLSSAQDVQRLVKQYQVLKEPQLKVITDKTLESFIEKLHAFCRISKEFKECTSLENSLPTLLEYHGFNDTLVVDAYLARFGQSMLKLQRNVNIFVDQRVIEQQQFLANMQIRQGWSTGMLVVLSLVFILFSTQFIVKPVRKLQAIIQSIATSSQSLPVKSSSAPRELLAVEKDLFWLNERLRQLEKVRTALLRHASHELKTPLASIKEGCAILSDNLVGDLNSAQHEVLQLLNNSTERLNLLIVKLLDYNALLQQAEPKLVPVAIYPVIDASVTNSKLLLQQNGQSIGIQLKESQQVKGDEELLGRIFDNLISNAIAYGRKNEIIRIYAHEEEDFLVLDVMNQGNSIPLDIRTEIFEPFKRGAEKRNDKVMGAGLGLSIVADCVRLLNGDISIVDKESVDVCFQIKLPRVK
ncbi:sensor histidine kinase [Agaribacter marinus]|uniref:histidine kinase n=1 Tax=Agaribacter marinus TaxID=1431249 RepID=A0AA37SYC2_9ALTE|nr:HAMP domain-containing sensor histidine kinase [Agaribacter marinus]GLR72133.1 two-component sensor histidine kinase [Agaribacter marinus]